MTTIPNQKPVDIMVRPDAPTASREYLELRRAAMAAGDLVASSHSQFRVELTDRVVEFMPVRTIAMRIRGRRIANYYVPEDMELPNDARVHLDLAVQAGHGWVPRGRATNDVGRTFCHHCARVHPYCECDDYAHLGTHSAHPHPDSRPHPMGE